MDTVSILRYVSCATTLHARSPKYRKSDPFRPQQPVPNYPGTACSHLVRCISSIPVSFVSSTHCGLVVSPCCFARMTGTCVSARYLCTERTNPGGQAKRHHQLGISCGNHQRVIRFCFSI